MFKLLAIRPLEGCADYIQKCLKTGMMYYFCNDYIIEPGSHIRRRSKNIKPLKEDFFTVVSEFDYTEDNSSERKSPTVSVSAIVGMNGDGKSTLVELMMRLINNCAISYKLCASSDSLRKVKGVKAELYYMVDNAVYRMAEEGKQDKTQIWKMAELDDKNGEMKRWEMKPDRIKHVDEDLNSFFFTIVSNYSHYAYNIYDYEKEWEILGGENDDDEKCWLHYIFHKNDGYLTPITLHPYRYKGNIDINNEKWLSKQRLLSLFLDADNPSENPLSFRRVNGKDAYILKLMEETESKLQRKAIIEYFKATGQENRFEMLYEEIDRVDEGIDQAISVFDLGFGFMNHYEKLVEFILPSYFIKPINQIVEQDDSFSVFASEVINWLITTNNVRLQGDIGAVVKHYDVLKKKIKECAQIITNNRIARVYIKTGDFDRALYYSLNAMKTSRSKFGNEHPLTAASFNNVGWVYYNQGNYIQAMEYFFKAMQIMEEDTEKYPLTATIYNNIGLVYCNQGDYYNALRYFLMALQIREIAIDRKYSDAATIYNNTDIAAIYKNIGLVYCNQGDYNKALENYMKALEIREKVLGREHLDTAASYNDIGFVYYNLGDYDMVLKFYLKALEIRERVLGREHPDTATLYDGIGLAYLKLDDYDMALKYYMKALEIREKVLGTNHPDIATTYRDIAIVYENKGDKDKATEYFNKYNTLQLPKKKNLNSDKSGIDTSLVVKDESHKEIEEIKKEKREIMNILDSHKWLFNPKHKFLNVINGAQLGRLDTLFRILKSCNIDWRIVTKNYLDLSLEEKCQHYYVYKIWSVLYTYPQYQDAYKKDDVESLRECGTAMEKYIDTIQMDDSHITRKLRQVKNFMKEKLHEGGLYERLGKRDENKRENILVEIDKLKKHYGGKPVPLDNLPPPIYKWDIIFKKKEDPGCDVELDSFSSGEKQMLYSIGAVIYHLQNLANTSSEIKHKNVNLIMEEIELYYHPEYQRQFFIRLLYLIQRAKLEIIKNINIVFVTHSPFILSDIPKCNVLFLKEGMPKDIMQENTFGANIHTLLKNGFFMPNLPIGEFAYGKINKLFGKLNSGELDLDNDLDDIYQEILLVGEPFLRNQLLMLYNSYKGSRVMLMNTNKKELSHD